MLKAALAAQALGFHIFPVAAGDKVPHRAAGRWGETATNDFDQILHFWTQVDPQANIGVACKPSQLLVVDLDVAKEPWKLRGTEWEYVHGAYGQMVSGEALFDEMVFKLGDSNAAWDTYSVRTGSGGLHLYYWWPADWPLISQASPVKGVVDVRGNGGQYGGYVLGPGSRTDKGGYELVDDTPIALPPEWIRKLVAEKPRFATRKPQGLRQPGAISYSGLVDSVRNAGEGNRNNALVWAARTMCEEGATPEECVNTLTPAALDAGLGELEVERTIQSAYRTQSYKESR